MKFLKDWWNKIKSPSVEASVEEDTAVADSVPTVATHKALRAKRITRRMRDPRKHAWHRVFGGIACSDYVD